MSSSSTTVLQHPPEPSPPTSAQEPAHEPSRLALGLVPAGFALIVAAGALTVPDRFPLLLAAGAVGLVVAVLGLRSPPVAAVVLLGATFFRLAVPGGIAPVEPFLAATVGLVISSLLWLVRRGIGLPRVGVLGVFIVLYGAVNLASLYVPHLYEPVYPLTGESVYVVRFVLIGIVIPLVLLLVGMAAFAGDRAMRWLLLAVMGFAGYSAFVSIMQFFGPAALVWPGYILSAPAWEGRAVGVFNQPVVNGLVMVLGYLAALLVATRPGEARWVRAGALALAPMCVVGVYLTYTRAAWLSFALVVVLGMLLARGWRRGFVVTFCLMVLGVVVNSATFFSSDRGEGGVASAGEIHDRLNLIATSLWALRREPLFGWGIGRFPSVNTFHHQQWSPSIPWERGFGIASHLDALGVAVELGLVGFVLWALTMGTMLLLVLRASRTLPAGGLYDRPMALLALLALLAWLITGLTVDLRLFDFPNFVVMLLVGAVLGRATGRAAAGG